MKQHKLSVGNLSDRDSDRVLFNALSLYQLTRLVYWYLVPLATSRAYPEITS